MKNDTQSNLSEDGEETKPAREDSTPTALRLSATRESAASSRDGEVVYRRVAAAENAEPGASSPAVTWARGRSREIAPAISPLIFGFTVLLALILTLGYLSVRRMDDVSFRVLDLEHQHAAKLGLLLRLRLGLTKLNNEARARQEADARRELKPPFEFRLSGAREEVNKLLSKLEKPPLSEDPTWRRFRDDLQSYVEVTDDLRTYSFEGFSKFRVVDNELDGLLTASTFEQAEVFSQSEAIEQEATRAIRLWSVIALLVGALVAAGTIWEVQRRFRQMRRSMYEARRERTFTTQLLEGMVSAVAAIDEHDRIRSANAAFFKIFPGASIGASVFSFARR